MIKEDNKPKVTLNNNKKFWEEIFAYLSFTAYSVFDTTRAT
jgi:hypothetical protein